MPTLSFSASETSISEGSNVTLTWAALNVDSCTASGSWTGGKSTSGNESVGPINQDSSYSMTCTGAGGSAGETIDISVQPSGGGGDVGDDPVITSGSGAFGPLSLLFYLLLGCFRKMRYGAVARGI
jgi:hypothetical protein